MDTKEIAEKIAATLEKDLKDVEPLGCLNVPIERVLTTIADLQDALEDRDFQLAMLILSHLYGIDNETVFIKRLVKTATTLPQPDKPEN